MVHGLVRVDVHGLNDLDELEGDLEGDGNEIVVKDEEGDKLPTKPRPRGLRLKENIFNHQF